MHGADAFIFRSMRCSASRSRHPTCSLARYVEGFVPLMRFQAERARATYQEALALLPAVDRKAQRPGLMMGAIYSALLTEIERENFQVLHQRIALTPLRKLWLAWRTWVRG